MDPRTVEINSLRVLNDYLNQTIEALVRTQRAGVVAPLNMTGISHSPFATTTTPFGFAQTTLPSYLLAHTPYTPYNTNAAAFATSPFMADPTAIDPFIAQQVLSHSAATVGSPLATLGPLANIARQLEALQVQRTWGVPF